MARPMPLVVARGISPTADSCDKRHVQAARLAKPRPTPTLQQQSDKCAFESSERVGLKRGQAALLLSP